MACGRIPYATERGVAISGISHTFDPPLFDHLVGEQLDRVGHFDAERPRRLQIDDELEFGRLHHRQACNAREISVECKVFYEVLGLVPATDHRLAAEPSEPLPITRRASRYCV
jgi:hypothetical protein